MGKVRPSKTPYGSHILGFPKVGGDFNIVVNSHNSNSKIIFDSFSLPNFEKVFEQFGGATTFSVVDLNSAYYHNPFARRTIRLWPFKSPLAFACLKNYPWVFVCNHSPSTCSLI